MTKRLQIKVYGRVQGVGFRFSAYIKFDELGLKGTAENYTDGTVVVDAQGEEAALSQLVEWCHQGPTGARVQRVEVTELEIKTETDEKSQ